jgi:hypothetical protein
VPPPIAIIVIAVCKREAAPMTTKDLEPIPFMQRLLDSPLLLLFLGVSIPTLLYTLWGVMEVVAVPLAK